MKKLFVFMAVVALSSFSGIKDPLTQQERKFAADFLTSTKNTLNDITKGLSEEQLNYKSAPDRWSVQECVMHIAAAEMGLWHMADSIINTAANPEREARLNPLMSRLSR